METSTFEFAASDGRLLFVYRFLPDEAEWRARPRGVVQLSHGLAEHAGRYVALAEALTAAGYVVYANDHRGHGKTARSDDELGLFAAAGGWARVVEDLRQLCGHAQAQHPGRPLVLLGHSMGSYLAQQLMYEEGQRFAAVLLSGTSGKPEAIAAAGRVLARLERLRQGKSGRSTILDGLAFRTWNRAFAPNRTAFDWLSRDPQQVDRYIADPHCGFLAQNQLWIDLLDALPILARPQNLARIPKSLPVYLFSGGDDMVSNRTRSVQQLLFAYQQAGLREVSHRFYPGARHESLNDTNRAEVIADLLGWLSRKLPA